MRFLRYYTLTAHNSFMCTLSGQKQPLILSQGQLSYTKNDCSQCLQKDIKRLLEVNRNFKRRENNAGQSKQNEMHFDVLGDALDFLVYGLQQQIYRSMSVKPQLVPNYWGDSKQLFFTPKLSLEGRNMFPLISDAISAPIPIRETPFLHILKKPIMSLYERVQIKSEKRPVCIVGMPKEVEARHIKTGSLRRTNKQSQIATQPSQAQSTILPQRKDSNFPTPFLIKAKCPQSIKNIAPEMKGDGSHYYLLGEGNNVELVEKILGRREGWLPTSNSIFHFRWEQARPKFQNGCTPHRQVFNHLPNHEAISDKGNLLLNLKDYCEKQEEFMYRIVPVSFYLDFANHETTEEELKHFAQFYWECLNHPETSFNATSGRESKNLESRKEKFAQTRRNINSIIDDELQVMIQSPKKGKKDGKSNTLRGIKNKSEVNNPEISKKKEEIRSYYKSLIQSLKPLFNFQDMTTPKRQSPYVNPSPDQAFRGSLWLLKPSDLNRGRGIKLFETVDELGQLLKQQLSRNQKGSFIIQKYLEHPLLIEERKFDIRVWALLTHNRELFFFRQGYIRLSSEKFSLDSRSLFTHLTNNAVQKRAANYGEFEEGNILPISYLYKNGFIEKQDLFSSIKQHIVTSMRAGGPRLHTPGDKNQSILVSSGGKISPSKTKYFQIFGYDFMIDSEKHVWLIEVNTNPCIQLSNKWLGTIIPRMLDDAFKLTLDRLFYRKNCFKEGIEPFNVEGYKSDENMWQPLTLENPEVTLQP